MEFGFGYMRLPQLENKEIDEALVCRMADEYLAAGYRYFDIARPYLDERCEGVLRRTVVERYPRDSFLVADKLSNSNFQSAEEIEPLFEDELRVTGLTYFDYYLVHCITADRYEKYTRCGVFDFCKKMKKTGKIKCLGFSFHDKPEFLERVLREHPEMEFVQIQMNYLDWEDPGVQSHRLYDLCRQYGRDIHVMEPVRGGLLANLPKEEAEMLSQAGLPDMAEAAFRFVAEKEGVKCILSGMNSLEQVRQNTALFRNMTLLTDTQEKAVLAAAEHYRRRGGSGCTGCGYCLRGCPKGLNIPGIISCVNTYRSTKSADSKAVYLSTVTTSATRAGACIGCGQCEAACPQKQFIRKLMKDAAKIFENE